MSKVYGLMAAAVVALGFSTARADVFTVNIPALQAASTVEAQLAEGLKWKVGDSADYTVVIGGFINGTAHQFVRESTADGLWVEQDMDLGMAGKEKIEELFDPATGQVKKVLANGQEQAMPSAADYKVIEMKEDSVTVAAGTFKCVYAKIQNTKDQSIQEAWMNPQQIPMSGLLKATASSQFGPVNQELQKFSFAGGAAPTPGQ